MINIPLPLIHNQFIASVTAAMLIKAVVLLCFIFIINIRYAESKFYKTNVTDYNECQIYYARSGSVYKDFFELKGDPSGNNNGSILDFHFSVTSPSDAHIMFAPSSQVQKDDPVYEIVIGAGGNTFCDIRRKQKSAVKATVRVIGLLNSLDLQSFWIHISRDGVIEVGKEGEELGFLTWIDPDPLPLKVFSFSTWSGIEAKWYFNCPRGNETEHSKKLERPMTPLEKLRKDLLFYYDPYVRPVENTSVLTEVGLTISTDVVTMEEHKSTLVLKGKVRMSWRDEKLQWNTSAYGGIDVLHIFRREIWVPNLYLFNSIEGNGDILEDTLLIVNSSGFVNWMAPIKLKSWCSPDDFGRWPRDEHNCDLTLGFYKDFQHLQLVFHANDSKFNSPYTSAWEVIEVGSLSNVGWKNYSTLGNSSSYFDPPGLTLHFTLRRTSNSYTIMLFTPFFVIAVGLLMTFWVSPFGHMKISLACLQLVLSSAVLIGIGLVMPIQSQLVPNLVLLYSYSLVASLIALIVAIVVINLSRNEQKYTPPYAFTQVLLSFSLKIILCLPDIKSSDQTADESDEFGPKAANQQAVWILLGIAIDRIAFLIYFTLASYALAFLTY